jgi:hypothetical protein
MGRGEDINSAIARRDNAGVEPKIGDVIEIGLTALDAGLPLRLKGVVRDCTTDGFRVEFLADTLDERRELSLFRQFLRAASGYTDA